jgi:pyruvate/2-oxoglutarate dehydrogenase complex dihydrolipoamide dehydrogenase (E3) component
MTSLNLRREPFDVVVIGAGAAGLVTASGAGLLGTRVALVEKDRFGGECLWTGCVPSTALLRTALGLSDARRAASLGLSATDLPFEFRRAMQSMRDVIARIQPHDDPETIKRKGVTTLFGKAEVLGPKRVAVDGEVLHTKRIVIATGSRPVIPPIPGLKDAGYLTHESALDLDELPGRLLILGAGPVGLEFAQIFNRFGSDVTVIELLESVLPREDFELADELRRTLENEGIRFLLGHRAVATVRTDSARELELETSDGSRTRIAGDEILVATGMRPFTEGLGLENAGVELDDQGAVKVDARMRTTASNVWAAGDVTGILFFTHVADYQARLVVRNMFVPFRARANYSSVPWAIYTNPALAHVGLTEAEARERYGDRIAMYRYPFDDLDRAITDRAAQGSVKLITDSRGRLLGGHVLGAHADTIIHEIALALRAGIKIGGLSQMVHAYPTWSEGVKRAADSYYARKFANSRVGTFLKWWAQR